MTLRSLLFIPVVCTVSTACNDALASLPYDGQEGLTNGEVTLPPEEVTPLKNEDADLHSSEKGQTPAPSVCLLSETMTCAAFVPDHALCEGIDDKCEYDRCLVDLGTIPLIAQRAECANAACPDQAVDLDRVVSCATELRDLSVECLDTSDCGGWRTTCPIAFSALDRVRFMAACMR